MYFEFGEKGTVNSKFNWEGAKLGLPLATRLLVYKLYNAVNCVLITATPANPCRKPITANNVKFICAYESLPINRPVLRNLVIRKWILKNTFVPIESNQKHQEQRRAAFEPNLRHRLLIPFKPKW